MSLTHYSLLYFHPYLLVPLTGATHCRAMEKENKKMRDVARRKYQDKVRALVSFCQKRDPRVAAIALANKLKKAADEEAQKYEEGRRGGSMRGAGPTAWR